MKSKWNLTIALWVLASIGGGGPKGSPKTAAAQAGPAAGPSAEGSVALVAAENRSAQQELENRADAPAADPTPATSTEVGSAASALVGKW